MSSFIIDVVFLEEVIGSEGEKAAAALIVLLLWRMARVVDGEWPCIMHNTVYNLKSVIV